MAVLDIEQTNGLDCESYTLNWGKIKRQVRNLQNRIFQASVDKNWKKVRSVQNLLINSRSAKLLAIYKSQGSAFFYNDKSARNKNRISKLTQKYLKFLETTDLKSYRPSPSRRVYLNTSEDKERPIDINTIKDKILQNLIKFALEAEWEAKFDEHSFGYRYNRKPQDAVKSVLDALNNSNENKDNAKYWIFSTDVKNFYKNVNHDALLEQISGFTPIIEKWLKSKANYRGNVVTNTQGIPQGTVIGSLLGNIALNGLEELVNDPNLTLVNDKLSQKCHNSNSVKLIRYVDDIVVITPIREELLDFVIPKIKFFLKERGLTLNKDKTRILTSDQDFEYLGYEIKRIKRNHQTSYTCVPTDKAIQTLLDRLKSVFDDCSIDFPENTIEKANSIIRRWAKYYRNCQCDEVFGLVDFLIYDLFYERLAKYRSSKMVTPTSLQFNDCGWSHHFAKIKQILRGEKSISKKQKPKWSIPKKQCTRCNRILPINNFRKLTGERGKKKGIQGFSPKCRTCEKSKRLSIQLLKDIKHTSRDAESLRQILITIKENEHWISQHNLKQGNPLRLKIYDEYGTIAKTYYDNMRYSLSEKQAHQTQLPTDRNLSILLGLAETTPSKWLKKLEKSPSNFEITPNSALKLYAVFQSDKFPSMLKDSLIAMISQSNALRNRLSTKVVNIINKHKNGINFISETWLGELLYKSFHGHFSWNTGKFKSNTREYTSIFGYLTRVLCLEREILEIDSENTFERMRQEIKDTVFKLMKKHQYFGYKTNEGLPWDHNRKVERSKKKVENRQKIYFDIVVKALVVLTKTHRNKLRKTYPNNDKINFEIYTFHDLEHAVGSEKSIRRKLQYGYTFKIFQLTNLCKELWKNREYVDKKDRKEFFDAYEATLNFYIRSKTVKGRHPFFMKSELKILQLKELFDICLGLDPITLDFFEDFDDISWICRHHLDKDRYWYLLFQIETSRNWKIKFVPLEFNKYRDYNNPTSHDIAHNDPIKNQLARQRITHLYKMHQKYNKSVSRKMLIKEFENNKWKDFDDKTKKELIDRFLFVKSSGKRKFYQDYYKAFYREFYIPVIESFGLYLLGKDMGKNQLFWTWYHLHYLRNNIYPEI